MLVLKANILGWSLRKKNKELFPPNWFLIMNDHHHIQITSQLYVKNDHHHIQITIHVLVPKKFIRNKIPLKKNFFSWKFHGKNDFIPIEAKLRS